MDNNDLVFAAMNEVMDDMEIMIRDGNVFTEELLEELFQEKYTNLKGEL